MHGRFSVGSRQRSSHRRANVHFSLLFGSPQKLFLTKGEPLQANLPPRPAILLEQLGDSRAKYAKLLVEKTKAPDDMGEGVPAQERLSGTIRNLSLNNPLSLHNEVRLAVEFIRSKLTDR